MTGGSGPEKNGLGDGGNPGGMGGADDIDADAPDETGTTVPSSFAFCNLSALAFMDGISSLSENV
jgi:hypothetical protein